MGVVGQRVERAAVARDLVRREVRDRRRAARQLLERRAIARVLPDEREPRVGQARLDVAHRAVGQVVDPARDARRRGARGTGSSRGSPPHR